MVIKEQPLTTISIQDKTWEALNKLKNKDRKSFDAVINFLLDKYKEIRK